MIQVCAARSKIWNLNLPTSINISLYWLIWLISFNSRIFFRIRILTIPIYPLSFLFAKEYFWDENIYSLIYSFNLIFFSHTCIWISIINILVSNENPFQLFIQNFEISNFWPRPIVPASILPFPDSNPDKHLTGKRTDQRQKSQRERKLEPTKRSYKVKGSSDWFPRPEEPPQNLLLPPPFLPPSLPPSVLLHPFPAIERRNPLRVRGKHSKRVVSNIKALLAPVSKGRKWGETRNTWGGLLRFKVFSIEGEMLKLFARPCTTTRCIA